MIGMLLVAVALLLWATYAAIVWADYLSQRWARRTRRAARDRSARAFLSGRWYA